MDSSYSIRCATLHDPKWSERDIADVDAIARLLPDSSGYRRIPDTLTVMTIHEDTVVAMGAGFLWAHPERPGLLHIKCIEVNEPYAGLGLERQMLDHIVKTATELGYPLCVLDDALQRFDIHPVH